jgi:hypothetical protein
VGEGRLLKLCENEETAGLRSKPGFVELLEHSV